MVLADVLMHAGIGTIFACTGACTRRLCAHKVAQISVGGTLILIEAAAMTAVVG